VLDYRLGDDNGATLCEALAGRRIPFVLYSGYSDLQESFPKYVILQKPASGETSLAAIAGLLSHDFGSFDHECKKLSGKIDDFDLAAEFGAEDPTNPRIPR
jgi:hypothetical protein